MAIWIWTHAKLKYKFTETNELFPSKVPGPSTNSYKRLTMELLQGLGSDTTQPFCVDIPVAV